METQHTQGPWRTGEGETQITTLDGKTVLSVPYPVYPANQPDEFSANIRLMAAAPEMLGFLETIADEWKQGRTFRIEPGSMTAQGIIQLINKIKGGL